LRRRTFIKYLAGATLASIATVFSYSYFIENHSFSVTKIRFDWGLGRRIVFISDTHIDSSVYNVTSFVESIDRLRPDMILHGGDHVSNVDGIDGALDLLDKLSRIAEVYTVWGNHDIWSGLMDKSIIDRVRSIENVYLLINQSTYCDGFWICGVNDPYTYMDNIDKTLENVDSDEVKILLAHSPQIIDEARYRVDLVLAGHTHGGQVNIPGIGALWLPLPRKYYKYVQGLFNEEGLAMYVTRGIGTVFLPIRFNCPPELVIIEI